jgi:hypothetical protein
LLTIARRSAGRDDDVGRKQLSGGGRVAGDLLHQSTRRDRPDAETGGPQRDGARDLL